MIDLELLRNDPEGTIALLRKKDPSFDARRMFELDAGVRSVRLAVEEVRRQKNELAQLGKGGVTEQVRKKAQELSAVLKERETELATLERDFKLLYLQCPNLLAADIQGGGKESNQVVKEWGKKPSFSFTIKNHVDLAQALGWIDFEKAALMTASNFALYKKEGARLLYALAFFMLKHNAKHGYEVIVPPFMLNETSLEVASNFPRFKDQVYAVPADGLYMTPTAEVNLTNLYRGHIFASQDLPVRMTAWTSCFRREAGGYGATERGLIRIHQFEKVELYTICEPEHSFNELDRMMACAEEILQKLGLHYRVSLLAAQDCSFPSAKTYDIEVWLPGQGTYYEVASCSNCTDFQARRGMIRYKKSQEGKTALVHTLNASSLALPRLMVALMETYQQADGSIALPEVLMKGLWE